MIATSEEHAVHVIVHRTVGPGCTTSLRAACWVDWQEAAGEIQVQPFSHMVESSEEKRLKYYCILEFSLLIFCSFTIKSAGF